MDFFRNFNNYKPKDFKGKTEKDILAMKPNKVPDDFFSAEYATKYATELADAGLMEEQLNAIQLLSDLKDKSIILKKCYTKQGKHSLVPGHVKRASPMPLQAKAPTPMPFENVEEATQTSEPLEVQVQQVQGQQVQGQQVQGQTGGRRSRKRRGHKSKKHTKRGGKKTKRGGKKTKHHGARRSRSKRSRSKYCGGTLVMTPGN